MKWGILATGNIAKKFASTVQQMGAEGESLAAVGSRRAQAARDFAAEYGIPHAWASYEELAADPAVEELVKAADKLSAHIKCLEELKAGNGEFRAAAEQTRQALERMDLPEVKYFCDNFLGSFSLTLDEME